MSQLAVLSLLFLLSACSTTPPIDDSSVSPSRDIALAESQVDPETPVTPVVHPLDVAAEAEQVVALYLQITDAIGSEGGVSTEGMSHVVTPEWLPRERAGFADYERRGIRTIGRTRFDHFSVQSARVNSEGDVEVAVFLCVDSTSVWVINRDSPEPPEDLSAWLEGTAVSEPEDDTFQSWGEYAELSGARPGFREPIIVWLTGGDEHSLRVDSTENWLGAHPCEEPS